jgi:hypothetical protein
MLRAAFAVVILVALLAGACLPAGCNVNAVFGQQAEAHYVRFHRYSYSQIDNFTNIDMVKDTRDDTCYVVYNHSNMTYPVTYTSVPLGQVKC